MYITDEKIITDVTVAHFLNMTSLMVAELMADYREAERPGWKMNIQRESGAANARMETIITIDRSLARALAGGFFHGKYKIWDAVRDELGLSGTPEEIVMALNDDYTTFKKFFGVIDGISEKVARENAKETISIRRWEQEARNADVQ